VSSPVRVVERDRADLVGAARVGNGEFASDGERLFKIGNVDHVEAEQLLLRLGERAVDDRRRVLGLAQGCGGGGRQQAQRGSHLADLDQSLLDGAEPGHDGLIFRLAPGPDDIFLMVAKDRVLHAMGLLTSPRTPEYARNRQHRAKTAERTGDA